MISLLLPVLLKYFMFSCLVIGFFALDKMINLVCWVLNFIVVITYRVSKNTSVSKIVTC